MPRIVSFQVCSIYLFLLIFKMRKLRYGIWQTKKGASILKIVKLLQAMCSEQIKSYKIPMSVMRSAKAMISVTEITTS